MQWHGGILEPIWKHSNRWRKRVSETTYRRCHCHKAQNPTKIQLNQILFMDTRIGLKKLIF